MEHEKRKIKFWAGSAGTQGRLQSTNCGNEVRNGLCFDCFCHEYCLRMKKKENR